MASIKFSKYQGTGNDFVLIDDRKNEFDDKNVKLIKWLCDRRFGIGGDGLMLLRNHTTLDFEMVYFNRDGNPSSMCGNGGRCITQFAQDIGVIKESAVFMAIDGEHHAEAENGLVKLGMNNVEGLSYDGDSWIMNTGSPHYVTIKTDVFNNHNFVTDCRSIRYNDVYRENGINVNQIELISQNEINARTYERGVEDETYSCGTGAVACAITCHVSQNSTQSGRSIKVNTLGGQLQVEFIADKKGFSDVNLIGPATFVFEGEIEFDKLN